MSGAILAVTTRTGVSTERATATVGGVVAVLGVAGFTYGLFRADVSVIAGVALLIGAAVALLWVVPVAVGTVAVTVATNADDPLRYAVAGWPVATVAPVAYLWAFSPTDPSTPALLGSPTVGTAVVAVAVRVAYTQFTA